MRSRIVSPTQRKWWKNHIAESRAEAQPADATTADDDHVDVPIPKTPPDYNVDLDEDLDVWEMLELPPGDDAKQQPPAPPQEDTLSDDESDDDGDGDGGVPPGGGQMPGKIADADCQSSSG